MNATLSILLLAMSRLFEGNCISLPYGPPVNEVITCPAASVIVETLTILLLVRSTVPLNVLELAYVCGAVQVFVEFRRFVPTVCHVPFPDPSDVRTYPEAAPLVTCIAGVLTPVAA